MSKKIIFLTVLFCTFAFSLFCDSTETAYVFHDTGKLNVSANLFTIGEHLNTAISPNVFQSYGIIEESSQILPLKNGDTFLWQIRSAVSLLVPSVPDAAYDISNINVWNFVLRESMNVQYAIKIPALINGLSLRIAPYLQGDIMGGFYPQITNIGIQTFLSLNLGVKAYCQYQITDSFRAGADFSSFLIGMDTGRNGYNKDYLGDLNFSHPGNYLDLSLALYGELDISHTTSLRIGYSHAATSWFGGENKVIDGEHQLGITFNTKVIE